MKLLFQAIVSLLKDAAKCAAFLLGIIGIMLLINKWPEVALLIVALVVLIVIVVLRMDHIEQQRRGDVQDHSSK